MPSQRAQRVGELIQKEISALLLRGLNDPRIGFVTITGVEVTPDLQKIALLREEFLKREGIFEIIIEARSGRFVPGDDLLFIIVAGDIRENI